GSARGSAGASPSQDAVVGRTERGRTMRWASFVLLAVAAAAVSAQRPAPPAAPPPGIVPKEDVPRPQPPPPRKPPTPVPAARDLPPETLPDGTPVLAVHPDGRTFAAAGDGPVVVLVDVQTGRRRGELKCPPGCSPTRLVYSPDGRWLGGTGGGKSGVWLWDL